MFWLTLLLELSLVNALTLHHRICAPSAPCPRWSKRATLASSLSAVSEQEPQWLAQLKRPFSPGSLYQLALESENHAGAGDWDISSIPACYLDTAVSERITLSTSGGVPYALHYQVEPTPADGRCSPVSSGRSNSLNTTVFSPTLLPPSSPELRTPPPLTAQGQPVTPEPEKPFIQKYWLYIVLFLGIIFLTGGGEEGQAGGQSGGGGSGGGSS